MPWIHPSMQLRLSSLALSYSHHSDREAAGTLVPVPSRPIASLITKPSPHRGKSRRY